MRIRTGICRGLAAVMALVLCFAGQALGEGGTPGFGFFPPGGNQQNGSWPGQQNGGWSGQQGGGPFGQQGGSPFGQPGEMQPGQQAGEMYPADQTSLAAMPSARSVRSGEEITLDYDLILSQEDMGRISIIQQGTMLEYTLVYAALEDESRTTDGGSGQVRFSMNREENERCTLSLKPEVKETSVLTVEAKMIFSDGEALECDSEKILVYTKPEIRSHLGAQECAPGEQLQADFMLIGPEGSWQFTCYLAVSADGGKTYTRTEEVLASFTVNTREQKPEISMPIAFNAEENSFCRIEADVILPDGTTIKHASDPVRLANKT